MPDTHRDRFPPDVRDLEPHAAETTDGHLVGDKVAIKIASHPRARGRVVRVRGAVVLVELANKERVVLPFNAITNYSRAARRAWKVMPKRAGRPRAAHPNKKMVSLRLDLQLIERLDRAVRAGYARNRSQAVAHGLIAELDRLGVPKPAVESSPSNHINRVNTLNAPK